MMHICRPTLSSPGRRRASAFYKTRFGGTGATFVRRAFKTKVILSFLIYGKAKASFGSFPATGSLANGTARLSASLSRYSQLLG
jgi:hypothetical protein